MAKKHRSEKAAPLAAPDRTSANDVQDTPHVTKVAYPPNPAVPYAGQSLGYFWFFLATREWLQKRIVGVGMIVEGVPIFTRPLVYEMPSGAEDATAENSEASVDGLTAITFKPEDVREIVDAEDGQNVAPGDGREVGVLADDRAMEIVDEYRRWQPTIDVLRRAMYRAGLIQPEARLTADVIRENLLNWLKSVCSLTEDEALQTPIEEVVKSLDAGASNGHPHDGDGRKLRKKPRAKLEDDYPTPENYKRDKWIYVQRSHGRTIPQIIDDLKVNKQGWEPLFANNSIREAVKRYATFRNIVVPKSKHGRPPGANRS